MPVPPLAELLAACAPCERPAAAAAAERLRVAAVAGAHDPAFAPAWGLLAAEFLDRGELEAPEEMAALLAAGLVDYGHGRAGTYHLFAAWEGDTLVGVRDCYVDLDAPAGHGLISLAHCVVAPAWRRRGLAALLRALPLALGRAELRARAGRPVPALAVAEMEPPSASDPASIVRLIAYGRAGFAALDPRRVPYAQPDFRADPPPAHLGIPLLGVVRVLDLPGSPGPAPAVPVELAAAFPLLFHATHRRYVDPARVDACEAHVLTALRASPDPVALLPLPDSDDATLVRLLPLARAAVLPLYPPALRGPPGDDEPFSLAACRAALAAAGSR